MNVTIHRGRWTYRLRTEDQAATLRLAADLCADERLRITVPLPGVLEVEDRYLGRTLAEFSDLVLRCGATSVYVTPAPTPDRGRSTE